MTTRTILRLQVLFPEPGVFGEHQGVEGRADAPRAEDDAAEHDIDRPLL